MIRWLVSRLNQPLLDGSSRQRGETACSPRSTLLS